MATVTINVLKHGKESYVYAGPSYGASGTVQSYGRNALINGTPADQFPRAVGDAEYIVVKGNVKSIELAKSPTRTLIHYQVKDEFTDLAPRAPVSIAEFEALDEVRRGFYRPIYREDPVPNVPLDVRVIDIDCKPRTFPAGVMVTVPDYLKRMKNTWHTLPCYLDQKTLYRRLVAAVRAECEKPEAKRIGFGITDYDNIQSLTVTAGFSLHGIDHQYSFKVLNWCVDGRYGAVLPQIHGNNLDDLNVKVDQWIDGQLKLLRNIYSPKDCPCCGSKLPKGKIITLPARRR
ncbi:hypothetical protein [Mesorhizobium sp. Z1-4]|uniref:hypothetical protein n=1 Tax=Mesorhizobium sp. Z1-4 TaxID=2448478 RepID=UPI000FD85324|nr:hypothetical protein [Mesorhizobium sp. Z1-4]